jgi:hypothetical protein
MFPSSDISQESNYTTHTPSCGHRMVWLNHGVLSGHQGYSFVLQ